MSASGPPTGEYTFIIERPQEASPQRKRPRTLTACDKWSVLSPPLGALGVPRPPLTVLSLQSLAQSKM